MTYIANNDFLLEVNKGNVAGHSLVHKFGRNEDIGATYEPLVFGGVYQTPQPAAATALRVKAGNANDTAAGTGAREVTLQGLDETGALVTEAIATAGASASSVTSATWIRVFRAWVSASGTYASPSAGSQAADIVIETSGGTEWLTIDATNIAKAQTQIGSYAVPLGKTAYLLDYNLTTDSNKAVDFLFFVRGGILTAAAPYEARRVLFQEVGIQGHFSGAFPGGRKLDACTDMGFLVKAAATADATADFNILLVDD